MGRARRPQFLYFLTKGYFIPRAMAMTTQMRRYVKVLLWIFKVVMLDEIFDEMRLCPCCVRPQRTF